MKHLVPLLAAALVGVAAAAPVVPPGKARTLEIAVSDLPGEARLRVVPGGPRVLASAPLPREVGAWGWDEHGPWVWDGRLQRLKDGAWEAAGRARPLVSGHRLQGRRLVGPAGELALPALVSRAAADGNAACLALENGEILWLRLGETAAVAGRTRREPMDLGAWSGGCVILDGEGTVRVLAGPDLAETDRFRANGPGNALTVTAGQVHLVDDASGYTLLALDEAGRLRWLGSQNKLGALTAVAVHGKRALVADARGAVHLLDVSRPDTPRPLATLYLGAALRGLVWHAGEALAVGADRAWRLDFSAEAPPAVSDLGINLGGSRRGRLQGDLLYVADWFSGLHIYDVRQPRAPRLVGNLRTPGSTKGVWVERGHAFIADDDHGLQVADVSDPARPHLVAELPLAGLAYTFERGPRYLYLAAHHGGVHILDIDDPRHPRRVGGYDTPGKAWAVRLRDHWLYVADDDRGLRVLDVADPTAPRSVHVLEDLCRAEDLLLDGDLAYLACFDRGLIVLDLADPARPRPIAQLPTPGNARGLAQVGRRLYLADWESGVRVYDLGDGRRPRLLGRYDTRGAAWGVLVQGSIAYALDWWGGIQVIDFADPADPRLLGRYQGRGRIHGLALDQGYAFAAAGSGGFQVYDVRNPLNPVWGGGAEIAGSARDVAVDAGLAAVAAGDDGLALLDVSMPLAPRWRARLDLPHHARRVALGAGHAWVLGDDGVTLVDLADPDRPRRRWSRLGVWRDLTVQGGEALLLDGEGGLWRCGVNNSTDSCPEALPLRLPEARRVVWEGDTVVSVGGGRLQVVDVGKARVLGGLTLPGPVTGLALAEGRVFLAQGAQVLEIDLFEPARPRWVGTYPASRPLGALAVGPNAILAGGDAVLLGGERLPPVVVRHAGSGRVSVAIPPTLPLGSYDLVVETDAGRHLVPGIFRVALPPPPKKKKFTLEDLQRILKSGDFPGRALRE